MAYGNTWKGPKRNGGEPQKEHYLKIRERVFTRFKLEVETGVEG